MIAFGSGALEGALARAGLTLWPGVTVERVEVSQERVEVTTYGSTQRQWVPTGPVEARVELRLSGESLAALITALTGAPPPPSSLEVAPELVRLITLG